jgi:hypothetical protein
LWGTVESFGGDTAAAAFSARLAAPSARHLLAAFRACRLLQCCDTLGTGKSRGNRLLMICSNASAIVKDGLARQWLTSTPVNQSASRPPVASFNPGMKRSAAVSHPFTNLL